MKNKTEYIEKIQEFFEEYSRVLTEFSIIIPDDLLHFKTTDLRATLKCLKKSKALCQEYLDLLELLSPETWVMYGLMGINNEETRMLSRMKRALMPFFAMKNRPNLLKPKYVIKFLKAQTAETNEDEG